LYIEVAESVNKRNKLIQPSELDAYIHSVKGELYRSLYIYDDSIVDYIAKTGSIKQFPGTVYPDKILLDFDGNDAIDFAREAIMILEDEGVYDGYQVYFSGRGFHIELDNELFNFEYSPHLPRTVKSTLSSLFPNADPIWDKSRIYRCTNTINLKSNLYRIPITNVELNGELNTIKELAKSTRFDWDYNKVIVEPSLQKRIIKVNDDIEPITTKQSTDYKFACIHNMLSSKPQEGSRHDVLLRLASHFKRQGYASNISKLILDDWVGDTLPHNRKGEVNKIIKDVYSWAGHYTCQDVVMKKYCNSQCPFFKVGEIEDVELAEKKLAERLESTRTSINLRDVWKIPNDFLIEQNELIAINGATGMGKSVFIQNIVYNTTLPTIYFSFEMPSYLLYRRFLQIGSGVSRDEVAYDFKQVSTLVKPKLQHLKIVTEPIFPNEIPRFAEQTGAKLIILDHIGLMRSKYVEEYNKITEITAQLRQITIKYPIIVVFIAQVSRENAKASAIGVYSGKGSGSIENDSSKVITIHRQSRTSPNIQINAVKDREGQDLDVELSYNNDNLRIGGTPRKE